MSAFSIGAGGTSVIIDLTKMPAPAYVVATFNQQNGLYTILRFDVKKGSYHFPSSTAEYNQMKEDAEKALAGDDYLHSDKECFSVSISGSTSVTEGAVTTYTLAALEDGTGDLSASDLENVGWYVCGNCTIISQTKGSITVKAGDYAYGSFYTVNVSAEFNWEREIGGRKMYSDSAEKDVDIIKKKTKDTPNPDILYSKNVYFGNHGPKSQGSASPPTTKVVC